MNPLQYKRYKIVASGILAILLQVLAFTGTAEATVCTNQCVGGYVTENYSCVVDSIYWPGGYYEGGWCGYPAGTYGAGTYNCYGTCQRQVWSNCATTTQVCTHPSATMSQSSASTLSGQSFSVSWSSSNASSCTVTFTEPSGVSSSLSSLSGSQSFSPNNPGTYSGSITCNDSGGETSSASVSHAVSCPSGTTWNGTTCVSPPTATISQSASQTNSTQSFTVSWSSTNASSCTVTYSGPTTPGTLSNGPTSGSASLSPQNVGTYTITNSCSGTGGSAVQSLSHTVVCPTGTTWNGTTCATPAPTVTVTQTKSSTASKEPFSASWTSTGATYCNITFSGPTPTETLNNQATSGTLQLSPQNLGTYTMSATCYNGSQSGTNSITHTVNGSDLSAGSVSPSTATVGTNTTFTATVTNNSSYSTVEGFSSFMQYASGPDGSGTIVDTAAQSMGVLAAGGSATFSIAIAPGSPATYSARACADKNSTGDTGTITESNEGNNCGGWTNIVVTCPAGTTWSSSQASCMPSPTVSITQTKNPTASKETFSASWTSTNTSSCDITFSGPMTPETLTGQAVSGTLQLSPQNLGTYTMAATCTNGTVSTSTSVQHTVNGSDLTAGAISPLTASAGVPKTFSATITNNSNYSTVEGFTSLFQQGTTATGGTVADVAAVSTASALAANGAVTVSTSYTFANSGVYYVRLCADKDSTAGTGTVTESNENNNCGAWTAISVTKAGDKTVTRGTAVSITSNMGGGITSCTTAATTYPSLSDGIRSAWNGTTKTNGQTTNFSPVLASPGSYVFSCTNGSVTDSATLNVLDCASGTTWDGSSCISSTSCSATTQSWSGNCSGSASSATDGGSVTVTNTAAGYTGSATFTCNNGSWSGPSSASCTGIPAIRNQTVNYPNISFICDNSTSYTVVRNEGSFSRTGSTTSGATVTVPITMEGNYTLSCVSGALNDSVVVNYTQVVTTLDGMSIDANPRTINNNKSTALSWSIVGPSNSCSLRAEAVCTGGRASCSSAQLAAETALNSTLTSGTTDANDPYGAGRNIQTAVKTVAPENNPTGTKALGKKTLLMNYSTDFILDCGGSLIKKIRVNVSAENEG